MKKNSFEFHVVVTTSTPLSSPNADEMLRVMISRGFSCWIFVYILIFFSDYIIIKYFRSVEHFFLSSLPVLFRSHPCDSSALRRSFIHMQPRTPHYISERRERAAAEAENIKQRRGKKRDSEKNFKKLEFADKWEKNLKIFVYGLGLTRARFFPHIFFFDSKLDGDLRSARISRPHIYTHNRWATSVQSPRVRA